MSYVQLLRAPNPGPMTLDGTNTWVITDADEGALVIDPGPAIASHLDAVFAACEPRLLGIVLTHRHLDHSEGAALLAERAGCGVRAADPEFRIGADGLAAGELLTLGSITLEVVETPGHTSDSRSLLIFGPDGVSRLITGDMVLGRGTTVITYPDGDLAAYFGSLDLLGARWSRPSTWRNCSRVTGQSSTIRSRGCPFIAGIGWNGWIRFEPRSRQGTVRRARSWRGCMPTSIAACGRRPSSRFGPSWSTSRRV